MSSEAKPDQVANVPKQEVEEPAKEAQPKPKAAPKPKPVEEPSRKSTRAVKQVEHFQVEPPKKEAVIVKGDGALLSDIPKVAEQIEKAKHGTELHTTLLDLHRLLYGTVAADIKETKSNVLGYSGVTQSEVQQRLEYLKQRLGNWKLDKLKNLCKLLTMTYSGSRAELSEKLADFMVIPTAEKLLRRKKSDGEKSPKKREKTDGDEESEEEAEAKPAEEKPAEEKPEEAKPADEKAVEAEPESAEIEPAEVKPKPAKVKAQPKKGAAPKVKAAKAKKAKTDDDDASEPSEEAKPGEATETPKRQKRAAAPVQMKEEEDDDEVEKEEEKKPKPKKAAVKKPKQESDDGVPAGEALIEKIKEIMTGKDINKITPREIRTELAKMLNIAPEVLEKDQHKNRVREILTDIVSK